MSYYQQRNRSRLTIGQDGNPLVMLIAINLIVFVLLAFIKVIYLFSSNGSFGTAALVPYYENILNWVTLPADPGTLVTRPWTIITHMFVHDGVWHIIGNMLWLWAFGSIFQDLSGGRMLAPVFIYGALAGALMYLLSFNFIPALRAMGGAQYALGASAGVMAVAIATTVMAPGYRIFPMLNGGIPLWVVTVLFVIIDLATLPYSNPGGHIAHLAGAGMGYLFMHLLNRGHDWSIWMNNFFDWVTNLFNPDKPKKGKPVKTQMFYKTTVPPYKKTTSSITQQKIDEILDKIGQKGYHSLTDDEKEILKRASREDL